MNLPPSSSCTPSTAIPPREKAASLAMTSLTTIKKGKLPKELIQEEEAKTDLTGKLLYSSWKRFMLEEGPDRFFKKGEVDNLTTSFLTSMFDVHDAPLKK